MVLLLLVGVLDDPQQERRMNRDKHRSAVGQRRAFAWRLLDASSSCHGERARNSAVAVGRVRLARPATSVLRSETVPRVTRRCGPRLSGYARLDNRSRLDDCGRANRTESQNSHR